MQRQKLENLIKDFSIKKLNDFFWDANFKQDELDLSFLNSEKIFSDIKKLGSIQTDDNKNIAVVATKVGQELSKRSSRKKQYDLGKKVLLSQENCTAGIFVFYDKQGSFRFSLIYPIYSGTKKILSSFKRYTYFANNDPQITNKTFSKQIGEGDFSTLEKIKEAFSIEAVTDIFYDDFFKIYNKLVSVTSRINKIEDVKRTRDFILLFVIRTIFIGFIQKREWIGDDKKFIQNFFKGYKPKSFGKNKFYVNWITPLFFEALNSPQGRIIHSGDNNIPRGIEEKLRMAPYLNGGLFKPKAGYDDNKWIIPDNEIEEFFEFLFSHNFTIEENSLEDEDLQLNPEFLGIIFERLVNKTDGAVYTPRTEVDLMCRLSLVKWLQKNLENPIKLENLYELFFKESEKEEDQKEGSFSKKEAQEILHKLESLAICDPAVGSGAFLVGMMQVLDEVEQSLKKRHKFNSKNLFERKKEIIKNSLYGVEVKEWAVWICQLRLWLSLFVDAPDDLKNSLEPILPSLDFKVRQGDSLIQRIGSKTFPIGGDVQIQNSNIKKKITELKKFKINYFDNDKNNLIQGYDNPYKRELSIYEDVLNIEILEKEDKLRKLKDFKPKAIITLFRDSLIPEQAKIEYDREEIDRLESKIIELRAQKVALHNGEKPLIWNIEFAEILSEKGGFDIIIGNPPYVRQESIADPIGRIKDKKEYKNYLQEMVKLDFPGSFLKKGKVSGQSDLYTYFYVRALRILNPKGIHTFICSNSWLDVGYGVWLQDFLLKRCSIEFIMDNHVKRSFRSADVNTIISIINAPQKKVNENHLVKFIAFKKSFNDVIFTENLLQIEKSNKIESNENFRVYPIAIKDLKEVGMEYETRAVKIFSGKYVGDKWGGKYLRAPDIFFTILKKGKDKLVKLGDIADVRFGIKTGVNDFFYLTDEQITKWKIEQEFLKPVIKSPRECKSISVNPKDLKYKIFICNKSKEDLKGTNALKYIEWGENNGFSQNPSVSSRKYWWSIGKVKKPIIFYPMINNVRLIFFKNSNVFNDANLVSIYSKKEVDHLIVSLNSTYNMMNLELLGIANLGEGAIKLNPTYIKRSMIINPDLLKIKNKLKILNRKCESIFKECGIDPNSEIPIEEQNPEPLPDRLELDKIVFDVLGLTKNERKEVYRAVCRLVWNRISRAENV